MTDKELVDWLRNCSIYEGRAFLRQAADRIEALEAENERLRRDKARLLDFARAIQTWRSDADSYDRECDNPQRNYCEDVELMEGVADIVIRQVEARAALGEKQ